MIESETWPIKLSCMNLAYEDGKFSKRRWRLARPIGPIEIVNSLMKGSVFTEKYWPEKQGNSLVKRGLSSYPNGSIAGWQC